MPRGYVNIYTTCPNCKTRHKVHIELRDELPHGKPTALDQKCECGYQLCIVPPAVWFEEPHRRSA